MHLDLLKIPPLRAGLIGLFSQNLILMGVFFTIPLYLQLVLGLDALETGIKMLPVVDRDVRRVRGRVAPVDPVLGAVDHAGGPGDHRRRGVRAARDHPARPRRISPSPSSMGVLGVGMGLIASQLGHVVQSSVDASGRGEAGGLQYTGQQLGSSLGVALIGAIVLAGLTGDVRVEHPGRRAHQRGGRRPGRDGAVGSGIDFVASADVEAAAQTAGLDEATTAGDRRRLRAGPAPVAQGRPARGGAARPRLARLHRGPAALRPCRRGGRGGGWRGTRRRVGFGPARSSRSATPGGRSRSRTRRRLHPP